MAKSTFNEAPQNAHNKHYIGKKIIGDYMTTDDAYPSLGDLGVWNKCSP